MQDDMESWACRHFDPVDQARLQDPYPVYKILRDVCPIARSDAHEGGFWVMSRYEDVRAALRDPVRFASGPSISIPALGSSIPLLPVEANPPRHGEIRKLVGKDLAGSAVIAHEGRMRGHVRELIAELAQAETCDLIRDFAFRVPAKMMFHPPFIGRPLSVAGDDWISTFQHWVHTLKTDPANSAAAGDRILEYLEKVLVDREQDPQNDIPSALVARYRDGEDLTKIEALGILFILFMGGIETPANAIGLVLLHYANDPEFSVQLRANPKTTSLVVEELLRVYGPSQGVRRTLTEDVELHGVTMKQGDAVWLTFNAADRDERFFDHPDELRYDRERNPHLGFGAGTHLCLGAPLARIMLKVILEEFAAHDVRITVQEGAELKYGMGNSRGLLSLPVKFAT